MRCEPCSCPLPTRNPAPLDSLSPQGIPDLQSAAGIVEVEVVEASNVPKMDYFQKSSPYCK
jgi:hypothetical protein